MEKSDLKITALGSPKYNSPISNRTFEDENSKIVYHNSPIVLKKRI